MTALKRADSGQRKYIRLDSVFPVEFRLLNPDRNRYLSDWLQGFTNNLSKGGICLSVANLDPGIAALIKNKEVKIALNIGIPLDKDPVPALARIAWMKEIIQEPKKYFIGLAYEEIEPKNSNRIMRYAWAKKLFAPAAAAVIILLALGFGAGRYINLQLRQNNKVLVEKLVRITQEASFARQRIVEIINQRQELQEKILDLQSRIEAASAGKATSDEAVKIKELNSLLDDLTRKKGSLEEQLAALKRKEETAAEELEILDHSQTALQKANVDKMYSWLKVHQNPRTGLIMSFEGDKDIAGWAFIYDQALALVAYVNSSDYERARKTLDFFKGMAQRSKKQFFNAYYVNDGSPAEFMVHSGPNIWLGVAVAQYTKKTGDRSYLGLAEEIASSIIVLQDEDKEGGIRGGPEVSWYSSEHNLDAYAFFNMLYKLTNKKQYAQASDRVINWLLAHTYDTLEIPVKRGKGDSTIATDTYAWSIAALGPQKLQEIGMDPDKIMEFAEEHCALEALYLRPEGQAVKVKGFDFAPQKHLARGGVVSTEWTAQMIISFRIMADFHRKKGNAQKANSYAQKADEYLAQLGKMIISSPSPSGQGQSCVPYATQDFVDTGHGWMIPKGKSTGSVAGTVYAVFAYYKYNPLELAE